MARRRVKCPPRDPLSGAVRAPWQVCGFVKQMSDYMEVADVIVTKAGPGTIAEATIRGLPTMLSSYLPGQEAGNVPFVVQSGFGEYSKDPRQIARTVRARASVCCASIRAAERARRRPRRLA